MGQYDPKIYGDTRGMAKGAVDYVADSNITLSGANTPDGTALGIGETVLCVAQTDQSENGPWTKDHASKAYVRPSWFDAAADVPNGALFMVKSGTTYEGSLWKLKQVDAVIGTDDLDFERIDQGDAQLVNVVITAPDAPGGGTTSALTLQVNDLQGRAIERAVVLRVDLSDTQYQGPGDGAANATMDTATTGSILAGAASNSVVIKTDAAGAFAATVTNAADETVYASARSADGGVDALAAACVVRGCVPDSITWSA